MQREQIDIMRNIRNDIGRMLMAIQHRDGKGYVPPPVENKCIQAEELKEEKPAKKKQDVKIKELDQEVSSCWHCARLLQKPFQPDLISEQSLFRRREKQKF